MRTGDLEYLKSWFSEYSKSFYSNNEEDQKNIMVKILHTENVCRNIVEIAHGLSLGDNETMLAEAVALFHDLGRFEQYTKYKTFKDAVSENHGLLGANILVKKNILDQFPEDEQELVVAAVKYHNAFAIPDGLDERTKTLLKLIRDADKVDIYRVFIDYYESPEEDRASATAFGLKDMQGYSMKVLSCVKEEKAASYQDLKTENDFRLLKLSWVYVLNYNASLKLLQERGCIDKVCGMLPHTDEIRLAIEKLQEYISKRLRNGNSQ